MLSGDGIPVIFHDDSLARTTNGEGLIYKTPLTDLKKLDAGSWKHDKYHQETIPTLLEAIEVISQYGMGLNLELKPCEGLEEETIEASIDVLKQHWPKRSAVTFLAASVILLWSAPRHSGQKLLAAIMFLLSLKAWQERLEHLDCAGLHIHQSFFDVAQVSAIKAAGYKIFGFHH